MLSTKITSREYMENMCYFYFQMDVCTHIVMCRSHENYFGQCFPIKFPNFATFTLYMCIPQLPDKVIFLISNSVGILTVLTQTILIRYEFNSVTMFVSKQKNSIFDEIRSKLPFVCSK